MWDVLSMVANLCGIFYLKCQICVGCLSKVANLCGMFCLRWQICVGCFI